MQYLEPRRLIDPLLILPIEQGIWNYCDRHHTFAFDPANPAVRLHEPAMGADEICAALEVLLSTKLTMGPAVRSFERQFADTIMPNAHGVACNSGSSANLLIIAALCDWGMLKPGDEVIVSALSWSTTIWPLVQYGLVPVIVDIDPATLNMSPGAAAMASSKKTRAIMPVHVYGNPMGPVESNARLIEDCCEALGASDQDRPVGSFGIASSFSFYYSHHITTGGEGGIAVTRDRDLAESMRIIRAHGWVRDMEGDSLKLLHPTIDPDFLFVGAGYNLRMGELQAAIGALQLPKLAGFVNTRRVNAAAYKAALSKYDFMRFQEELPGARSSWFGFPIILTDNAPFTVAELRAYLASVNIESRPIIAGNIAAQPGMKRYKHRVVGKLPHASRVLTHGLSIGCHHHVNAEAVAYVVEKIAEFVK